MRGDGNQIQAEAVAAGDVQRRRGRGTAADAERAQVVYPVGSRSSDSLIDVNGWGCSVGDDEAFGESISRIVANAENAEMSDPSVSVPLPPKRVVAAPICSVALATVTLPVTALLLPASTNVPKLLEPAPKLLLTVVVPA